MQARSTLGLILGLSLACSACAGVALAKRVELKPWRQGSVSGYSAPDLRLEVVESPEELRPILTWIRANSLGASPVREDEIDFSQSILVAAFLGSRPTGGFGIKIEKAEIRRGTFRVKVKIETPPKGHLLTQTLTSPFAMARIERSALKGVRRIEWTDARGRRLHFEPRSQ